MKRIALKKPKNIPKLSDLRAKMKKSVMIVPGELQVRDGAALPSAGNCFCTTPNNIILTISLKTPSPYMILNNFGDLPKSTIEMAAITSLEQSKEHILSISYAPISSLSYLPPFSGWALVSQPSSEAVKNSPE